MTIKDITPPAVEPVTLSYAKTFLRVDGGAEDTLITDLIRAARLRLEEMIRASLISRRRLYRTQKVSDSGVIIDHSPVTAIHAVRVIDKDGVETALLPSDYRADYRAIPARLCLRSPWRWHQFGSGTDYVEIELEAGFGTLPEDIPMPLRQAVLLLLAQSYEHRDSPELPPVPMMVDALIMPYRSLKL